MMASTFFMKAWIAHPLFPKGFEAEKPRTGALLPQPRAEGLDPAHGVLEVAGRQLVRDEGGEIAPFALEAIAVAILEGGVLAARARELGGDQLAGELLLLAVLPRIAASPCGRGRAGRGRVAPELALWAGAVAALSVGVAIASADPAEPGAADPADAAEPADTAEPAALEGGSGGGSIGMTVIARGLPSEPPPAASCADPSAAGRPPDLAPRTTTSAASPAPRAIPPAMMAIRRRRCAGRGGARFVPSASASSGIASVGGDIVSNAGDERGPEGIGTGSGVDVRGGCATARCGPVIGRGGCATARCGPVIGRGAPERGSPGRGGGSNGGVGSGSCVAANDTVEIVCVWSCSWKSARCVLAMRSWSSRCAVISAANSSRMNAPS